MALDPLYIGCDQDFVLRPKDQDGQPLIGATVVAELQTAAKVAVVEEFACPEEGGEPGAYTATLAGEDLAELVEGANYLLLFTVTSATVGAIRKVLRAQYLAPGTEDES